jgi:transposase, IS5 family
LTARIPQTVKGFLSAIGAILKSGTVVDATLIAAPSSTKGCSGEIDPDLEQSRKGQQ